VVKLINNPGWKFKRFLADDYDLLNEACHLLASLQRHISVTIHWVKGHYKGAKHELQHILNEEAHHLAHSYEQPPSVLPINVAPPSSLISLHCDFSITSKWKAFVNTEAHKMALQAMICKNTSRPDRQFNMVDWPALGWYMSSLPWIRQLTYCKLLHGILNTNNQNHK